VPTYEYECQSCGKVFEKFHSMSSHPRVKCPDCGGRAKKLIGTGAGIIFKGSGFYETDYRRKGSGKPAGAKPASGSSDAGTESGGDSASKKSDSGDSAKSTKSEE